MAIKISGTTVIDDSRQLSVTGVNTLGNVKISSGIVTAVSGVVTYYGDGSNLQGVVSGVELQSAGISVGTGITAINFAAGATLTTASGGISTITIAAGGGSGEFNTGITSVRQFNPVGFNSTVFTFPSTSGKRYILESITATNVSTANTEVHLIAALNYTDNGKIVHFAYNTPLVPGGSVELLKQPHIANPSDFITMWSNNYSYVGVSNAIEVYMTYTEKDDTDYFGVGVSTVGIGTTSLVGIFTSSTYPSVIQSIHLVNRTDDGDYAVSVQITNGTSTSYLAKDLVIPRYATVELCDRPKRIETNGIIKVSVGSSVYGSPIDFSVSGKKITG